MNQINKSIGVVIPVYNCKRYIEETIKSIETQPLKVKEIVLIDDGSTDGSSEICKELSKKYDNITYLYKENGGVSTARNKGIDEITTDYIIFCDADDVWVKGFLDYSVNRELNQGFEIVAYEHYKGNDTLKKLQYIENKKEGIIEGGVKSIWAHGNRHLGCMFFLREFLIRYNIRFPEGLSYNEDEIFKVYTEVLCKKIKLINIPMYIYRQHSESSVHNLNKSILERYKEWMAAWENVDLNLFNNYGIKTDFGKRFSEMYYVEMCVVYVESLQDITRLKEEKKKKYSNLNVYPDYMKSDAYLLYNHWSLFLLKHKLIGILRKAKRFIKL